MHTESVDEKNLEDLAIQARWLAERYERISEGFSSRAGVLLGLLAVEVGVLGQVDADPWLLLVSVLAVLACGAPFILTLSAKSVRFPEASLLVDVATANTSDPTMHGMTAAHAAVAQLLQPARPERSVVEQFKLESQLRAQWFKRGLALFAVAQVLVAITVLNGAFDARNTRAASNGGDHRTLSTADPMVRGADGADTPRRGSVRR